MLQVISLLLENKPGALMRVTGLLSARGYNIESLTVARTTDPELSRMTIVVDVEPNLRKQVIKQMNKLINVLKIVELERDASVSRELMLVKVRADASTRSHVLETAQLFRANIVDVAPDAVTIEVTGSRDKLDALLRVLEPFGIRELVKSGAVALGRGSKSMTERALRPLDRSA